MSDDEIARWAAPFVALFSIFFWRDALGYSHPDAKRTMSRFSSGAFAATFVAVSLVAWFQPPPLPKVVLALLIVTFATTCVSLSLDQKRGPRP